MIARSYAAGVLVFAALACGARQTEPELRGPAPSEPDPSECGRFTLADVEALCESLQSTCSEDCEQLQAAVGMRAFQPATLREEVMLLCGDHLLAWFEPAESVHDGCFPRPECYATKVRRVDAVHEGRPGWVLDRSVWWDDDGICQQIGQPGDATLPERFVQREAIVNYLEARPHGQLSPRYVRPIDLADYFTALGVDIGAR